jgi:hypothetical protein
MEWLFRAKVVKVLDYNKVDLFFDLGFGIKFRNIVIISDFSTEEDKKLQAKNCLIVLIGGHRIVASSIKNKYGNLYDVRMYLYNPIKLENVYECINDFKLPCVNKIMNKLKDFDYDSEILKSYIPQMLP